MDLSAFLKTIAAWPIWQSIEDWPVGQGVAESTYLFPLVESIHVVSLGFVVGSIFFLDLRLMGMACLLYTSPSPRDRQKSRMPSSA